MIIFAFCIFICDPHFFTVSRYSLSIGYRYYYWHHYEYLSSIENMHKNNMFDHGGYKPKESYVTAKYESIKEEILNNTHHRLNKTELSTSIIKTQQFMNTTRSKKLKARQLSCYDRPYKRYGISRGKAITFDHILSVILYCDHTKLSNAFSKTFRTGEDP